MRTRIEYNTLIFYMEGRIDSGTASLMEQEMSAAVESAPNAAFLKGVPCAIPFDIVKVGNCYGAVYELLDAEVLEQIIKKDKAHLRDHIRSFAREIHSLHQIEVEPDEFADLGSMALIYKLSAMSDNSEEIRKTSSHLQSFSRDESLLIWDTYLKAYLDTEDQELIKKAEEQIVAYSAVRFLFTAFTVPGLISKKVLTDMKTIALDYCRHIEPLCFQ